MKHLDPLGSVDHIGKTTLRVNETFVAFTSWSTLLDSIGRAVIAEPAVASDVHRLAGLCDRFQRERFMPLTRAELDDLNVPRRVVALEHLAKDIFTAACEAQYDDGRPLVRANGARGTHFLGASGREGTFAKAGFWFGLSHHQCFKHGTTPIWLRFAKGK